MTMNLRRSWLRSGRSSLKIEMEFFVASRAVRSKSFGNSVKRLRIKICEEEPCFSIGVGSSMSTE